MVRLTGGDSSKTGEGSQANFWRLAENAFAGAGAVW